MQLRSSLPTFLLTCLTQWSCYSAKILEPSLTASDQEIRFLKGAGAITQLESGVEVQIVRIGQTFFGTPGVCEDTKQAQADLIFATFLDPNTLEPTCGLFERNVGGCFEKTLAIGCDPQTKIASIDLYVRDSSIPGSDRTDNPDIGKCRVGNKGFIRRAYKINSIFDCKPNGYGGPGTCSASHNECSAGTYCNFSELVGYGCKTYVPVGASCGGYTLPGEESQCNPNEAFCFYKEVCEIPDIPGVCVAFLGNCQSDDDCAKNNYCDKDLAKCKPKLVEGDCCSLENNLCASGFYCKADYYGRSKCKAYASIGSDCGGFIPIGEEMLCNPADSFCYDTISCSGVTDAPGTCYALLEDCRYDSDCAIGQYCDQDRWRCREMIREGICCYEKDICLQGLECRLEDSVIPGTKCLLPVP